MTTITLNYTSSYCNNVAVTFKELVTALCTFKTKDADNKAIAEAAWFREYACLFQGINEISVKDRVPSQKQSAVDRRPAHWQGSWYSSC